MNGHVTPSTSDPACGADFHAGHCGDPDCNKLCFHNMGLV